MELTTLFAWGVGLTCSIHLLSNILGLSGKGIYSKGTQQAKRDDWYCFFKPSDLLGANWGNDSSTDNQLPDLNRSNQLEKRHREQANRPRLHA